MPVKITDLDGISSIHTAERLQIDLSIPDETIDDKEVTDMTVEVYFNVTTRLPSGKEIGQKYWDNVPLKLDCKNNPQLAEAMRVMQQAIGAGRYAQMIAPVFTPIASPTTKQI